MSLLVTVSISSKDSLPPVALSEMDAALGAKGLRKQVRSVMVPGKEYTTTYESPTVEKAEVERVMNAVSDRYHLSFSVDIEESVSFP